MSNGFDTKTWSLMLARKHGLTPGMVKNFALRGLVGGGVASVMIDDKTFKEMQEIIEERDRLQIDLAAAVKETETRTEERDICNEMLKNGVQAPSGVDFRVE